MNNATHVMRTTGSRMLSAETMEEYYKRGLELSLRKLKKRASFFRQTQEACLILMLITSARDRTGTGSIY
ncbi:hypothetical protein ACFY5J_27785 [Peribacillus butanolivorans]|uniref:hypothetical protein n=1 Tax=Peribacillus butanolivorans TaxID=421767 RepID=UPI00367D88CD